jgi:hypothetical protein
VWIISIPFNKCLTAKFIIVRCFCLSVTVIDLSTASFTLRNLNNTWLTFSYRACSTKCRFWKVTQPKENFISHKSQKTVPMKRKACYWKLVSVNSAQITSPHPVSLGKLSILFRHLCLGLPTYIINSFFPTQITDEFHISHMHAICSTQIILRLFTVMEFGNV